MRCLVSIRRRRILLTVIFALVGSGTRLDQFWQVAIAMALFIAAAAIGTWLYRRYRRGRTLGPQLDHRLGVGTGPREATPPE